MEFNPHYEAGDSDSERASAFSRQLVAWLEELKRVVADRSRMLLCRSRTHPCRTSSES